MKFESSLGTLWLNANQTALTHVSYTAIDETPLANQEILQSTKNNSWNFYLENENHLMFPILLN